MIAVRGLPRAELERKLSPYKCKQVCEVAPGIELWVTGWNEPFTLCPEDGRYDEQDYRRVVILVAKTMPPGWNGN